MFIYSKNQLARLRVVKPLNYSSQLNARTFITTVISSRRIAANIVELINLVCAHYKSHVSALHLTGSSESSVPFGLSSKHPKLRCLCALRRKFTQLPCLWFYLPPNYSWNNIIRFVLPVQVYLIDFSILVYPAMSKWQPHLMLIRGCVWASTLSSAQLNGIIRVVRHRRYVLISVSN